VGEQPLLRLQLVDGRPATLLLGDASTVLSVDDRLVSSWDLAGRPYALVRDEGSHRRGLDGRLLLKREATAEGPRVRRRLSAAEGTVAVEAARLEAEAALAALEAGPRSRDSAAAASERDEARRRLHGIVGMDADALARDAARFLAVSGLVGILPPDQYLALVVRVTEGCSWNACGFCTLYRGVPFRFKPEAELRQHVAALREYFGASLALRRSVFLGDANALCLDDERLLPLVEVVSAAFPGAPLFSFVDAWTGRRRSPSTWRELRGLGLRRVYVGLETGDPGLHAWLGKPGAPADVQDLVASLHDGGVAVGVILLLGAGGERFAFAHVARTSELLSSLRLGARDLLYFSEYVEEASREFPLPAETATDLRPLSPARCAELRRAIQSAYRPADPTQPPKTANYDLREFVY
jgi:radical SAM superfamily enzyme YgiQ (UPF0313 family)